jgi:protein involved in polysaccharide export with SLBB domain
MRSLDFVRRFALVLTFAIACWGASALPALALVHAGDELQVTVYNHPDLSQKVIVDASESISLPLAGRIDVRGLEPPAIAQRIELALDPYFKSRPAVAVILGARPASLFISGGAGGVLKYEPGETLAGAIASVPAGDGAPADAGAGLRGLERSRVDLRDVAVVRDGARLGTFDVEALSASGRGGPELEPGDTIVFTDKPDAVRVLGDVVDPGMTFVASDESLADAIRQAGGVRDTAASTDIALERSGVVKLVALGDPDLRAPAHDGDVITIPTAPRVSVAGLVAKPGAVTLKSNFTLLSALYEAGGPTKQADLSKVLVVHDGVQSSLNVAAYKRGDISQNPKLADGDLVFVPDSHRIDFSAVLNAISPIFYLLPRI